MSAQNEVKAQEGIPEPSNSPMPTINTTPEESHEGSIDSNVLVWRDKFLTGWNPTDAREPLEDTTPPEEAEPVPMTEVWTRQYKTDAHCVAYFYEPPAGGAYYRLVKDSPVKSWMNLLVIDVDCPEVHGTSQSVSASWWVEELDCVRQLPGSPLVYQTRGGYRVVYRLSEPRSTEGWSDYYLRVLTLLRDYGVIGDPNCKDWTRCFRLPHATRYILEPERRPMIGDVPGYWPVADADLPEIAEDLRPKSAPVNISRPIGDRPANVIERAAKYLEKIPGAVSGQGGSKQTFVAACALTKGFALTEDEAMDMLEREYNPRCDPPWSKKELLHKVRSALKADGPVGSKLTDDRPRRDALAPEDYEGAPGIIVIDWRDDQEIERLLQPEQTQQEATMDASPPAQSAGWQSQIHRFRGRPVASARNVALVGTHDDQLQDALGYDSFSGVTVWLKPPPWQGASYAGSAPWCKGQEVTDNDGMRLSVWLSNKYGINMDSGQLLRVMDMLAEKHSYHPVVDYLRSTQWDGVSRLGGKDGPGWLTTYAGVEDSEYVRRVGRMFLISMVAHVVRPGDLVKNVLVLEGEQDARKSTFCSVLGGQWYSESLSEIGSKDSYQDIRGVWLLELAELAGTTRAENNTVKHYIAKRKDRYRESYGRKAQTIPRQTVFIGTTNQDEWARDETGGSRWWPVRVGYIDIEAVQRDRDQLFAEAVAAFEAGEKWYLEHGDPLLADFRSEQEARRDRDIWESEIAPLLSGADEITMDEVLTHLGMQDAKVRDPRAQARAKRCLLALGWERHRRSGGDRSWCYVRGKRAAPRRTVEEIRAALGLPDQQYASLLDSL